MDEIIPWFVDICNLIVASKFPLEAFMLNKEKIKSDAINYIWDDPYLWRLYSDQVIRKCILNPEIQLILHFCYSTSGGGHYGSTRTVGSIGPPFSETPINLSSPANNVKEQGWPLAEGMKCPSNQFCFVKSLILWGPFLISIGYSYILLVVDYVWCAKSSYKWLRESLLQSSYVLSTREHTIPRGMAKLKYSIGKSRKICKRWQILAEKTRADSLRMLYGHTGQHTRLR
ncbi:hypothetical protein CR513_09845, partial [Mucuna pruriens]